MLIGYNCYENIRICTTFIKNLESVIEYNCTTIIKNLSILYIRPAGTDENIEKSHIITCIKSNGLLYN